MSKSVHHVGIGLVSSLLIGTGAALGQSAEFIPIPGLSDVPASNENVSILSGSAGYSGVRVSADGNVVATLVYPPGPSVGYIPRSVARWTRSGGVMEISPPLGGLYPATGISRDGSTIVGEQWVWTAAEGYTNLAPVIGYDRIIFGCSSDGQTVTGISGTYPAEGDAFRWRRGVGVPTLLPRLASLPNGYSYFNCISGDGRVVGGAASGPYADWTFASTLISASGAEQITPIASSTSVTDLNEDGSVAVGYYAQVQGAMRAFRWTRATGFVTLEAGSSRPSYARAVNDDGSVVVGDYLVFGTRGTDAFIWRGNSGLIDLRDELVDRYGLGSALQGWRLLVATDVSADGSVIVGQGVNPAGQEQAFIVRYLGPICQADFNADGGVDGADIESFFLIWAQGGPRGDVNEDGGVDGGDVQAFFTQWETGC